MAPSLIKVFPRLSATLQHSQVRHLPWPKGRALGPFNFPFSRNYTHHHSLEKAESTNMTTEAQKSLTLDRLSRRPSAIDLKQVERSAVKTHDSAVLARKPAYRKGWGATKKMIRIMIEHPVICALVASGVLLINAPRIIKRLGFTELGPGKDSFASGWQSRYGGHVPKDSSFSFFQRWGMIWK